MTNREIIPKSKTTTTMRNGFFPKDHINKIGKPCPFDPRYKLEDLHWERLLDEESWNSGEGSGYRWKIISKYELIES